MATTQAMPMSAFVARCLEEIGLEGRCGLPVRDMFELVDDASDVLYRRYAWKVLRAMGDQVAFHFLLHANTKGKDETKTQMESVERKRSPTSALGNGADACPGRREKRRRKWSTTLMHVDEGSATSVSVGKCGPNSGLQHRSRRRKRPSDPVQSAMDELHNDEHADARDTTANRRDSEYEEQASGHKADQDVAIPAPPPSGSASHTTSKLSCRSSSSTTCRAGDVDPQRSRWLLRSPRGYDLGEEVDVTGLSYEDAIASTPDGVLGVVACKELRLKYLGVVDPTGIDSASPQFDLLEVIGRAREQGANAAHLAGSRIFGDSRKLHYLLDVLIASGYVEKNIVTSKQKRFNILHLARFAKHFHPSMISPTATLEKDAFPKDQLPQVIARILTARGESACVFADIGRELGFGKRHQEKLRKYFFHQMHIDSAFPLELFMARCNTGTETKGRKLWCVRIRTNSRSKNAATGQNGASTGIGPVIERGIMEQMFTSIQDRQDEGATIPELRDILGVPTFKLPYKLAQGLISNYEMSVEQVVLGKSTMYRMFASDVTKREYELPILEAAMEEAIDFPVSDPPLDASADGEPEGEVVYQPSTIKEATRGMVITSTADRRRQYIAEQVEKEKIVSIHQLRTRLIEIERPRNKFLSDAGQIDIRSVRRIVDELEKSGALVTIDITIPPKRVLQKSQRVVKCVALPEAQRNRDAIRAFLDTYLEEQQRKFVENLHHENDSFIVVSSRQHQKKQRADNLLPIDTEQKEIVKYSATSYKTARVHLVKLHKQSRRLGMYFGILYRCRAFHLLIWDRLPDLRIRRNVATTEVDATADDQNDSVAKTNEKSDKEVVFALKEILDMLSVHEYIQLVGVSELLTEGEENKVRMAIARGDSWEALSSEIQSKVRACEADRFSRVLRVLIELELLHIANASSHDLLRVMKSTDDFDQVISQVAFATLSGGLFQLNERVRIRIKRGNKVLKQLPTKHSYVYAAGFSGNGRSEQFSGRIPLDFRLHDAEEAKEYWKALRFLSLEGARLGTGTKDSASLSVSIDGELVRPAPLRDHNIYVMKVWVPRATTNYSVASERARAAADAVGPVDSVKRKRLVSSVLSTPSRMSGRTEKIQRRALNDAFSSAYRGVEAGDSVAGPAAARWRELDGWGGAKSIIRAAKWSSDDDIALMDLYIEKLSCQWFIDVPLALQRRDERVAFRTTELSRTKISWKVMAHKLNRKRQDCMLRVRELLSVPAVVARVEKTKEAITRVKNPGAKFDEEHAVMLHPRLTALLCRALQIIFHERASYYSVLADMLISHWKEWEVKLVWRYLWLAGVITRTTKANEGKNQKQRGFSIHSQVHEMKSLNIPHYTLDFFCDAAEYSSFLQQNIKEAEMIGESEPNDLLMFEQDVDGNAKGGQVAVDLAALVIEHGTFEPEYSARCEGTDTQMTSTGSLLDTKKAMAIKGFAGHLSKTFDGALPDDFLKEYWSVKAKYHAASETFDRCGSTYIPNYTTQAFSSVPLFIAPSGSEKPSRRIKNSVSTWALDLIEESGATGISMSELHSKYDKMLTKQCRIPSQGSSGLCFPAELHGVLEYLVRTEKILEVNGATCVRFVVPGNASMWTLNPYRIANTSNKEKVQFVFDRDRPIVSRPWLHLDGSVNSKVAIVLKRRVVNIVMCSPGIDDRSIHMKMRKVLTLQDTRSILEELMVDDIVYARIGRRFPSSHLRSVFGTSTRASHAYSLSAISPGELRYVDNATDKLHYFPAPTCVELLGAAACDIDLGRSE